MSFIDEFNSAAATKETENGAFAYNTTTSSLLDLFALVGGMRDRDEDDIISMFHAARSEDKELADKIVLYARNIREAGLGERRIGKILLKELATLDPNKVIRNFQTFVDNGRFDDLYCLEGTPVEREMWQFMFDTLMNDIDKFNNNKPISLAAKWMKSPNTSSKESRRLAKKFCAVTNISEKFYRKTLSNLRSYIKVVEKDMSSNQWDSIDFEKVPSVAMNRYGNCFDAHCPENFEKYLSDVKLGKAKINAKTLYPYDIVYQLMYGKGLSKSQEDMLFAQWDALPNYFTNGRNVVCCADVSGSMMGLPMATSIGLALYCARFNTGAYKGSYLTFTDEPRFFHFKDGTSLKQNIKNVLDHVGYNTNLDGALQAIFHVALQAQDAPEALLIVSDSEIDYFIQSNNYEDIVEKWVKEYERVGLKCPKIIFWNVAARQNTYLGKITNPYVGFISGCSAGTFANLNQLIDLTPYELMCAVLDKYEFI